jgi:hypothetical protein
MALLRLSPMKIPTARASRVGTCSACGEQIADRNTYVLLYGELFHRDCAFYRPRAQREADAE